MGEGWGDGEKIDMSIQLYPPPLHPLLPPPTSGGEIRKGTITALPQGEGKQNFYDDIKY
jgi:hypothetical protein